MSLRIERTAAMMTATADHRAFGGSNKVTYIEIFLMLFNILVVMYYQRKTEGKLKDLHSIFICSNSSLYFHTIDLLMMAISLYVGFWITEFLSLAGRLSKADERPMWQICSLLPGLLSIFIFSYIVQVSRFSHIYFTYICV